MLLKKIFFAVFALLLYGALPLSAELSAPNAPAKKILLISSFHLTHTWSQGINNAILSKLENIPGKYIVDYLELNSIRNREMDFTVKFAPYLNMLQSKQYDLVIAILDDAMRLLLQHHSKLPPDLPIIFCGYQELAEDFQNQYPNITGLAINFDIMNTIELGLKLMPDTEEIAIITDSFESGNRLNQRAVNETKNFTRCKITMIHGADHTTQQMLEAVKQLPEKSFLIFAPWRTFSKDGFASLENVAAELGKQPRPFFVVTDVLLEHGAVGGYVSIGAHCGQQIASQIHQILTGGKKKIPFIQDHGKLVMNALTMKQYQLPTEKLPKETILLHKKYSLWDEYADVIVALIAFILLILILLSTTLILHLRFRSHTRRSMLMFNALPLRIAVIDRNGELLFYQGDKDAPIQHQGIKTLDELLKKSGITVDHPLEYIHHTLDTGKYCEVDFYCNGKMRKAVCGKLPKDAFGKDVVMWISQDVTDLYTKQQELDRNLELMNRAAEVSEITYFRGNESANVMLTGGNLGIGMPAGDTGYCMTDWIIPEDRSAFSTAKERLLNGQQEILEHLCRSDASGMRRTYRIKATRDNVHQNSYFGIIQDITEQKEAQKQKNELISRLNSHVESERFINACLTKLVTGTDISRNIEEILSILSQQFQCKFTGFGNFLENGTLLEFTHEWHMGSKNKRISCMDFELQQTLASLCVSRQKDQYQLFQNTADTPLLPLFHALGVQTLLAAPVWIGEQLTGVFCIGFIRHKYQLTARETDMLPSAVKIISLAKQQQEERKVLDAAVHEREIIFKNVKVPIMLFDHTGKMIRVNPAAADMCGITPDEAATRPCYQNFCQQPEPPDYCPIQKVLQTGKHTAVELKIKDREYVMNADPIFDSDGNLVNIVENALDMTMVNQQKRELEHAMKAAQTANRAKSYFLSTMSHELRTPLNAIIGFSELLQKENYTRSEEIEYLKSIHTSGNGLLSLITDILDLTKLEADQVTLNPSEINLNEFFEEIDSIFKHKAQRKKILFRISCPQNLPILSVDSLRLRQILLNLIGNAIKFTPENGAVEVTANLERDNAETATLKIKISDNGIGISEDFQKHMFEPFAQQDSVRGNRAYDGSGLGLTITRHLVDKMNGKLICESTEGKGTSFTLQLQNIRFQNSSNTFPPVAIPAAPAAVAAEQKTEFSKILLVDDVPMNLKVLASMLKKLNMETYSVLSGKEALELLKKEKIDIVLTDMWMPEMNGEELAAQIRKNPDYQHILIYAITADTEVQNHFDVSFFSGILQKPILLKTLQKFLLG